MRLFLIPCLILILGSAFSSELCKENEWYDDFFAKCRECTPCSVKSLEVAPCTSFMNTMCADMKELNKSVWENIKAGEKAMMERKHHAFDLNKSFLKPPRIIVLSQDLPQLHPNRNGNAGPIWSDPRATVAKSAVDNVTYDHWDLLLVTALSILIIFLLILIILTLGKYYRSAMQCRPHKTIQSKLVPRDRLNTTEYMKNLATLDRRLAIDEILEKRKRAIFEPKLMVQENIYSDDVFIDISGFPHDLNNHHYESIDNKKLLLEMEMETKSQPLTS